MVDALIGALIAAMATAALALAVEFSERAIRESGIQPLNRSEQEMLKSARLTNADIQAINQDLKTLPMTLRK